MRLQVFLSRNGVCSRRNAMDLIKAGHVTVNDRCVREPSTGIDSDTDRVHVDGQRVKDKVYTYVLLHKPTGYVTTKTDRFAEKTVFELLPKQYAHLSPVGRLDKNTEGLLLFTNDGDMIFKLTHPKFHVDKTYFVKVAGKLDGETKLKVEKGVWLKGWKTAPAKIKNIRRLKDETMLNITIHEGRKRQIRLMFAKVKHKVMYLQRVSQGPLQLGVLKKGRFRVLKGKEIERLSLAVSQ